MIREPGVPAGGWHADFERRPTSPAGSLLHSSGRPDVAGALGALPEENAAV